MLVICTVRRPAVTWAVTYTMHPKDSGRTLGPGRPPDKDLWGVKLLGFFGRMQKLLLISVLSDAVCDATFGVLGVVQSTSPLSADPATQTCI